MKNKILGILIVLLVVFVFTPQVKASTLDDLMAQIKTLSQQVSSLQTQMSAFALSATGSTSVTADNLVKKEKWSCSDTSNKNCYSSVTDCTSACSTHTCNDSCSSSSSSDVAQTTAGSVNPNTVPVTTLPLATTPTTVPTTTPATPPVLSTPVSFGTKGEDVQNLQSFLIDKGLLAPGNVDGIYGKVTTQAVKTYQAQMGLSTTGSVDNGTLAKINGDTSIKIPKTCEQPALNNCLTASTNKDSKLNCASTYCHVNKADLTQKEDIANKLTEGIVSTVITPDSCEGCTYACYSTCVTQLYNCLRYHALPEAQCESNYNACLASCAVAGYVLGWGY